MKASPHSNGVHRELTKIPEIDLSLARQEAARIAQAAEAARQQREHISGGTQHYRASSSGRTYGDISTSGLTSIPSMPQAGVSALSPYTPPAPIGDSTALVPYVPPQPVTSTAAPQAAASPAKKGFSLDNIKGMFDRMGGVDGIVATMGQAQKVMQSVSQFAPMAKLLMGSFLSKKGNNDEEEAIDNRPRRRRKRKQRKRTPYSPSSGKRKKRRASSTPHAPKHPPRSRY